MSYEINKKFIESETLELKKTTSEIKEAIISIAAILNKHQHGELFFGIRSDGTVTGQNITEKTIRDISKSISDHIEPKIYPYINRIEIGGKACIKVRFYFEGKKGFEKLGENEIKILDFIEQDKFVTIPVLSKSLKISTTAVENNLVKLKRKKVLKRVGPAKGGYWEVVKK